MITETRKMKIMNILREEGSVSASELCKILYASASTIRRDLAEMEASGSIQRVHGGAVLKEGTGIDKAQMLRISQQVEEKQYMANIASRFLSNSRIYFFDSGTTVRPMVEKLAHFSDITAISNGLRIIEELIDANIKTMCTGGVFTSKMHPRFVGKQAIEAIEKLHADIFFFSAGGIDLNCGITDHNDANTLIKSIFMKQADMSIMLADHTKFEKKCLYQLCPIDRIDYIITDREPENPEFRKILGSKLICC